MDATGKTNQELFDGTVAHLRKQGAKSLHSTGGCAYRGLGGLQCAVGYWIPDELYDVGIESHIADSVGVRRAAGYTDAQLPLMRALQWVHDEYEIEVWEDALKGVAAKFNLIYIPPAGEGRK